MGTNTRIINKFQGYSIADCACELCIHYAGRSSPCPLEICCCIDEKAEAAMGETSTSIEGGLLVALD